MREALEQVYERQAFNEWIRGIQHETTYDDPNDTGRGEVSHDTSGTSIADQPMDCGGDPEWEQWEREELAAPLKLSPEDETWLRRNGKR